MTYSQFINLDDEAQNFVFKHDGVRVAERTSPGYIYQLYQLHGFYIEIQYNVTIHKIQGCSSFDSMYKLDPYLEMLPIVGSI